MATRSFEAMAQGWQPMETAPKDGTEILIELRPGFGIPAYWCDELQTFVLSRPLHIESVREPTGWKPRWQEPNQGPKPRV